jgi:hypothetical protein
MKEVLKYPSKASIGIPYPVGGFFIAKNPQLADNPMKAP